MKYSTITYSTRLGKMFGRTVHFEAENREEAIKKCDSLVIALSNHHKDCFAYTEPKEED